MYFVKPRSDMLFQSFVVAVIAYCLPIIFTCLYASEDKCIRMIFSDAIKPSIDHPDIDSLITKQTKTVAPRYNA